MDVEMIVEIPAGSRNKYEMDHRLGRIRLDRTLFTATAYPADYGYVTGTLAEDDDPLDALVLLAAPTFPGCAIRVRPIGVFWMRDEHGRDAKLLCVPSDDPRWAQVRDITDVSPHVRDEIGHFFDIYKTLEPGKHADTAGWQGSAEAGRVLDAARRRAAEAPADR
ncbi:MULTISPECIES: inorganic diphosphatase [Micromonospora]|uniref:Inorganic pyrophosphatase n=1 Tax=Micromonospora solifontis TaxID=2487138 RepID=A0ABX9WC19_9ACTN|nr:MULTISPECIES: inorganic diphosphatase [Micromonospora]NES16994.1 inorganic diphosphatase [Micromonospora sp. PPF5-17B]NES38407.1 inorganic diphosphatase [Micromonospora solifontis]NES58725.1 inorganic diphosphatase [Micromonospora sp. PPF5-6]RNL95822.1 inorganic diphosphatase [Micromonospora solifontis]